MAKCNYCNEKASITLEKKNRKVKVNYCRVHWLALCMQETFKHFKLNNLTKDALIRMYDFIDYYSVYDPKEFNINDLMEKI